MSTRVPSPDRVEVHVLSDEGVKLPYARRATEIYAHLRQTWERAIEEVVLGGVVQRFRRDVQTQKLRKLNDLTQADLDAVEAGMKKSSTWEGGHDHALGTSDPVPLPDELKRDIDALDDLVRAINKRRA